MPDLDDDYLDGICDLDAPMAAPTEDEEIPWLVLFASIDFTNPVAVEAHRLKWVALFGRRD